MQCPDKGLLQAYLDNEVSTAEKTEIEEHLAVCTQCRQTAEELAGLEVWAEGILHQHRCDIENIVEQTASGAGCANNNITRGGNRMKRILKKWTAAAASVAVLTAALTFAPVQDALADFLSIFRVQKVQMVKIDPDELQQMAKEVEEQVGEIDLRQFGKIEFQKQVEPKQLTPAEAEAGLPFAVKQPAAVPTDVVLDDKVIFVPEGEAEFELDVEQVNAMLKSFGAKTMLPETLQGKTFSIKTPAGVEMKYLDRSGETAFSVHQFASPEINVPQGVDADALRLALLDIPFIPQDLRTQLAAVKDWQNTLIVPTAEDAEAITVNGNDAVYSNHQGYSSLIWVEEGVIYQIYGQMDKNTVVSIAESLQ